MKKKAIVVTNNPKAKDFFEGLEYPVIFIDGGYGAVLEELRKKVHLNYELLTHPLSGSIKPNETPFKSVAIHKGNSLDMLSLELISNAVEVYERLQNDLKTPLWTEAILDDFMVIDLDLIKNALI
ncbi:MAG: GrdX family protein [Peptostreptococcaceae bacterium]|nr:GrdX family protein [Peptostreptococcaceae bacterium]